METSILKIYYFLAHKKLLFELIRVYPSNPLYFSKLTQINSPNSVYSYCVKNNKQTQSLQIINSFKIDEIKKYTTILNEQAL